MANDARDYRVWVGNLPPRITEELLYELFIQAGPVEEVFLPKHNNRPKQFAFVTFKHQCSVSYAKELFKGTKLFGKDILIEPKMRESTNNNNESINSSNHINGLPKMQTREDFSHSHSNIYSLAGNSSKGVREMKTIDNNNRMNYRDVDFYGKSQYHSRSQNSHLMPTEKLKRSNKSKSNNEVDFDQLLKMANELVNPLPVNSSNDELQKSSNNMGYRNDARNSEYYSNRNRKHFDKTHDYCKDSNSHLDDDRFLKDMRQRNMFDREENIPRHRNEHYNNVDGDRNLESHRDYNMNPNRARGRDFNHGRDNGPRQFDKNHSFRHNDRYNRSTPYHHYSNSHRR